jgi:hypothetical protein
LTMPWLIKRLCLDEPEEEAVAAPAAAG